MRPHHGAVWTTKMCWTTATDNKVTVAAPNWSRTSEEGVDTGLSRGSEKDLSLCPFFADGFSGITVAITTYATLPEIRASTVVVPHPHPV